MPFHRTIGISLALVMASAGAFANAPERSVTLQPAPPPSAEPGNSANRSGKSRAQRLVRFAAHPAQRYRRRQSADDGDANAGGFAEPRWGPMHAVGMPQIGQASWYDLVGRRTADGERLDTTTPTAAHRSLPLGSCARVIDLDTGQSIIVKINDRGPYNRRFIIDLSPEAARELGMRHAGVAAVAVEAVVPAATSAVYRSAENDSSP